MKKRLFGKKAFSLIELMIVVAIIGILAAIALPNFARFQRKARQAEAKGMLASYHTSMKSSAADFGCFRGNFVAIGFQPEGELYYRVTAGHNGSCTLPTSWAAANDDASCVDTSATCSTTSYTKTWTERAASAIAGSQGTPAVTNTAFVARAASNIGGAQNDEWTINQDKLLQNLLSGL